MKSYSICLLLLCQIIFVGGAWGAECKFFDGFKDNGDGTVTDPRSSLIWKRCAEGFTWNGKECKQEREPDSDWYRAMHIAKGSSFLGKKDWRLPSLNELNSVTGRYDDCAYTGPERRIGVRSASKMLAHDIRDYEDGGSGDFWSYESEGSGKIFRCFVSFSQGRHEGEPSCTHPGNPAQVRLVRSSQSSESAENLEFNFEYSQLAQAKHNESIFNAARDSQNSSRQICEAQKSTCFASCPSYIAGANNDYHFDCNNKCNQISCD